MICRTKEKNKYQEANVLPMHFKQAWAKHWQAYNRDQSCITRKEEGLPKPCISLLPLHLLLSMYKAPCMLHCLYELAKQTPGFQCFDRAGSAASKQKLSAPLPWVQSPYNWLCIRPPISTSKRHDTFLCVYQLTGPVLARTFSVTASHRPQAAQSNALQQPANCWLHISTAWEPLVLSPAQLEPQPTTQAAHPHWDGVW